MASILITDGEQRSALAAARSLGRRGHTVFVAADRRSSLAGASRYVRATSVVPNSMREPAAFVSEIRELILKWRIDLLLPVTEAALIAILPERDGIDALLPFPTADDFKRLCDKQQVAIEAEPLGIRVPSTVVVESVQAVAALETDRLSFPLVLKPHRSVTTHNGTRAKGAVRAVADKAELYVAIRELPPAAFPVLVQEHINGPGVGIFVLLRNGEVQAAFAHKRIREKPPWGGVSVYRESIPLDQRLLERSVELLRRFNFEGAAMVEYKVDDATNVPFIMEINGRFWGSLQLAIDAGVDFPALLVESALDRSRTTLPGYRPGTRSRWFWGDVDNLLLQLRGKNRAGTEDSRLKACLDFVRAFGPGNYGEVFRLSDPLPAVRETIDWIAAAAGRSHS